MIRILMLTHNMAGVGGSYMRAHSLARALVKLGMNVTLMASRRNRGWKAIREVRDGVQVIQMADFSPERVRHGGMSPFDLLGRLAQANGPYQVVHGFDHRPVVSITSLAASRKRGIPFVSDWADLWGRDGIAGVRPTFAGRMLGWADHLGEQQIRRFADAITVVSCDLEARAHQLGIPGKRVRLLQVGANEDVIHPLPKAAMRAKYGLPEEAHIMVNTGFSPYDASMLARTFALLARRNPRALLLMTGARLHEIDDVAEAGSFSDRVVHLGFVPYERLGEVLACGDVMLLPLVNRGVNLARYPNRVGDFLAAGRPIATQPTGEVGSMVIEEAVGIVTGQEPEAFAEGIDRLLQDEDLRLEMGRRARRLAETKLSWRVLAGRLIELYQELLQESR
jgi:glycosyltransferase involved in cell wall biosynthesis